MAKNNKGQPPVAALLRGLDVLRCFANRESLGSSEIARMTGLPQPTVWRLCKTLERGGYLLREPIGGRFRLGLAVLTLGFAALETRDVARLARAYLQDIADAFHGAAALSTRNGLAMIYLQRCESKDAFLTVKLRVGSEIPIATSGVGWAYLAGLTVESRKPLVEQIKRKHPEDWRRAEKPYAKALEEYSRTGFVVNADTFFNGLTTVAVPVHGGDERRLHILNCSVLSPLLAEDRLRRRLGLALIELANQLRPVIAT